MARYDICRIDSCLNPGRIRNGKVVFQKGYCRVHYYRLSTYGSPSLVKRARYTGQKKHPLYTTWVMMKQRCNNPNNPKFKNYGARGVKVCERWLDKELGFDNFCVDMGRKPEHTSLDRVDNNGDYEPLNCRWATAHVQMGNRRNSRLFVGVAQETGTSKWSATLNVDKVAYRKSGFSNMQEAVAYRQELERRYL